MLLVAVLCCAAAMAQTCTISVEDVNAVANGKTVSYVEVLLNESTPGKVIFGASFRLALPAGVSIAQRYSEDDEKYVDDIEFPAAKSKHMKDIIPTGNDNEYQFSAAGESGYFFKTSTNVLCRIGIVVAESVMEGDYDMKVSKVQFARYNENLIAEEFYQDDFSVKLTVARSVGINSINPDDVNAPIYNVAGQRVSKAQNGIFIQNGNKIVVK